MGHRISRSTPVYLCDPAKNRTCDKHSCWAHRDLCRRGTCRYTTNPKHAAQNEFGPVRAGVGELQNGDRMKHDPLALIDESTLSGANRVGLAYCRLNCWQWDPMFGPDPVGFAYLPNFQGPGKTKHDYIAPIIRELKTHYPESLFSRCWWVYYMGKTEQEWLDWYTSKQLGHRVNQSDDRDDGGDQKGDYAPNYSILRRLLAFFKPG